MQQNAPFCVLKTKIQTPPPPTDFSLERVGMYDIISKLHKKKETCICLKPGPGFPTICCGLVCVQ